MMLISQLRASILIGLLLFLHLSCSSVTKSTAPQDAALNLDWLLGNWMRNNESQGRTTYEIWDKTDGHYNGIGVTISTSGDTIFREDVRIMNSNGQWVFEVSGVNQTPTEFTFQEYGKGTFSVQNLNNEFPKFIKYWRESGQLKAKVYNDSSSVINFSFEQLTDQ